LSNTLNSTWGNGKFYMNNIFDAEPTDHFMISFLDLGYLRILIEEPGIQATIPALAPAKTLTNISIKRPGQPLCHHSRTFR